MSKEVVLSENAGFCFGANRGYNAVKDAIGEGIPIYTYGPILNNSFIVRDFEEKGVRVVNDLDELESLPKGKIIIRSHGVSKAEYDRLSGSGFEIFDATCPFVKRIHRIVEKESAGGSEIIVVGNPKHPEVMGIVGWSQNGATVIENSEEADNFSFDSDKKYCVVSQTTFNRNKFQELVELFEKRSYNILVMNTICDATSIRQTEAEELSKRAEVMIVIGDLHSSNSKKLYEICKANCEQTYFIQELSDIVGRLPKVSGLVGITAGASTPKYIIEEVQSYVRNDV
ncbi:MAG: 4-hydroxy-3-methylbut-2-enyl diphosphate reductase [Lachnospiraceae bacterium]|nr:4-hydroxy-3-methylbut-2-enyl diphosphate reductase [Lachnospiraceae bacterium]